MQKNSKESKNCKVYHIFYTKDLHKKKKIFKEGVMVLSVNNMGKIYDEDGEIVTSFKNKEEVVIDQQYTVNNSYLITIDKQGKTEQFSNGNIFIKKNLVALPVKKKAIVREPMNSKTKIEDFVDLDCGLTIEKKLLQILRPHQKQGVQFMYECISGKKNKNLFGCILADHMGLGKTLQTLAVSYSMIRQKQIKKFIIVCPLTLLDVWDKQTKKWLQQKIIPLVCLGDGQETKNTVKKFINYEYRMLIISYEAFYKNIEKLSGKSDLIIFDEGHRMKNKKSKLLLKLKTFICQKRIVLTGTPIQNNLQQLYTCISIINPRIFGSEAIFKNVFQKPILEGLGKKATQQQKKLAKLRTIQLSRQLKDFSLRRTVEVLKNFLPARFQHLIFLKLTPLQKLWYARILEDKKQKQQDMFKTLNYLRKLFIHPSVLKMKKINFGDTQICHEDCSSQISHKITITLQIIINCLRNNQKCVIVSYFTETLDYIGNILKEKQIGYAKLDGRQSVQQRKLSVLKFEKNIPVLLLSGKAGGTGLTLVCATKMVMMEPDWNPSNDSQVMGRIWRQGQQKQVDIYRLITACSFEQKILQRQSLKKTLANSLIDNENQKQQCVDLQNLGKLFIQNRQQVLSYPQKQNQLKQFILKHQFLSKFEEDEKQENGIMFVKTISTSHLQNKQEKQQNQFQNIQLINFIKEGKDEKNQGNGNQDDQQDSERENGQNQLCQIEQIQDIKTIIENQHKIKQKRVMLQKITQKPNKLVQDLKNEVDQLTNQQQINLKDLQKGEQDEKTKQPIEKEEECENIVIARKNQKTEVVPIGKSGRSLLSKIVKK